MDARQVAEASFPEEIGVGIRRTTLHQILVDHAQAAGVTTCWQVKATGVERGGRRIGGRLLRCRWIVGADGAFSQTRHWAGLASDPGKRPTSRLASALSREALDGLCGGPLGKGRAGLCHAGGARRDLRRAAWTSAGGRLYGSFGAISAARRIPWKCRANEHGARRDVRDNPAAARNVEEQLRSSGTPPPPLTRSPATVSRLHFGRRRRSATR